MTIPPLTVGVTVSEDDEREAEEPVSESMYQEVLKDLPPTKAQEQASKVAMSQSLIAITQRAGIPERLHPSPSISKALALRVSSSGVFYAFLYCFHLRWSFCCVWWEMVFYVSHNVFLSTSFVCVFCRIRTQIRNRSGTRPGS